MARRKEEEEEYELSCCAEDAINLYYPDTLVPSSPWFSIRMIELQIALILCKIPIMFPADRQRASKTLKWLKEELANAK